MAVVSNLQGSQMVITVQDGTTAGGVPTYADRKYSKIKAMATDADIYAIATAIGGLQVYVVTGIKRVNTSNLVNV